MVHWFAWKQVKQNISRQGRIQPVNLGGGRFQ